MHRLDKNTSGLCMVAKEPQIQYAFDKQDLGYKRLYLAICEGRYPSRVTTVHAPIGRCPDSIITRCVRLDGKPAWSDFTCLAAGKDYSLLQVVLHTGRTHQIRVHSSYLGYPWPATTSTAVRAASSAARPCTPTVSSSPTP